jgi:hypothetical protein
LAKEGISMELGIGYFLYHELNDNNNDNVNDYNNNNKYDELSARKERC